MPRNDTGQYSLAVSSFVPFTRILNTAVNDVLVDISNSITQSMPPNGVVPMTGPLRTADGALSDLAVRFENDPDCGLYTFTANNMALATNAQIVGIFADDGRVFWSQSHTFAGDGFLSGAISTGTLAVASTFFINNREVTSFASGVRVTVFQAAAPTSWTKITGFNDYTMRVQTTGGGIGGAFGWSTVMAQTTFGNNTFSPQPHNHTFTAGVTTGGGGSGSFPLARGTDTGATAPTQTSGSTSVHNHTLPMATLYLDMIIVSKN